VTRRFKKSTDSIEYNWPLIPSQFSNFSLRVDSYRAFFEKHQIHTNPICFRAAIFCNFLGMLCAEYELIVDVNQFNELRPKFQINMIL
jgi:hypothetical protein